MKIFILAAGDATRWDGKTKQLMPVRGESVLRRTVNMIEKYQKSIPTCKDGNYCILTCNEEIIKEFSNCAKPNKHDKLLWTVISSMPLWKGEEEICFLLGDVIFTEKTFLKIMEPTNKSFQFYGSWEEHFGFRFNHHKFESVRHACNRIARREQGTTWQLYRFLTGIPLGKDWHEKWHRTLILDKTDDIDYPEDYEKKIATGYFEDKEFDYEKSY